MVRKYDLYFSATAALSIQRLTGNQVGYKEAKTVGSKRVIYNDCVPEGKRPVLKHEDLVFVGQIAK